MNQQRGFPTVTELIETILSNARYVIPDDQKDQQAEKIDPTTIPRTQSVHEILRNAIQHHLAEPSHEAVDRTPEELHKKSEIREALNEAWNMDTESPTPVSNVGRYPRNRRRIGYQTHQRTLRDAG